MISRLLFVLSLVGFLLPAARSQTIVGGQEVITLPVSADGTTKALLSLPSNYDSSTSVRYALIFFLHGNGESGTNINQMFTDTGGIPYRISKGWIPEAISPVDGKLYKFIVVAPQAPIWSYSLAQIEYMLPAMEVMYRIDTTRIYITGLSAGGEGAFTCVTDDPNFCGRIAGIAPMSATPVNSTEVLSIRNGAINHLPVWDICGTADATGCYPNNVAYIDTFYSNNANPYADSTWMYGVGHSTWYDGYNPGWYGRGGHTKGLNVYEWFLLWQRGGTIPWGPGHYVPPVLPTNPAASVAQDSIAVKLPLDSARLDGWSSTPPAGGSITGYSWTVIGGPGGSTIKYPDSAATEITGLTAGTYTVLLTVTTNLQTRATATVTIIVTSTNQPPVAIITSPDTLLTLPDSTIFLSGSQSYAATGEVINQFQWQQLAGPQGVHWSAPTAQSTWVDVDAGGTYLFRLTVTDNLGRTGTAAISITVAGDPHEGVEIYPNPVQGSLSVVLSGTRSGKFTFHIYDMDGRLMQATTAEKDAQEPLTQSLDVVDLAKGAYFLEVLGGNTKVALPFLKMQ